MRVLLVSSSSGSRGGGEIFLLGLADGLVGLGHEVVLWASEHERMDELCAAFSTRGRVIRSVYRNTYDYWTRSLATLINDADVGRIAGEWESVGADVIHVNKQNLEDGLDLLQATRLCRAPSVCTIHLPQGAVVFGARLGWLRDWVAARELRAYGGLFASVLEARSVELRRWLDEPQRVVTIDNGVAPFDEVCRESWRREVRGELGWDEGHFVVGCVARLVPQKRPQLFLDLALRYFRYNPKARFLWVGDGVEAEAWDARVRAEGGESFIRRVPWQSDVRPFLAGTDLYLHTAQYEGCPLALLEALMAGLPAVVSRDLLETMSDVNDGSLLAVDVTKGLEALDLSVEARGVWAQRGQALARRRFSLEAMARGYAALYGQAALLPRL